MREQFNGFHLWIASDQLVLDILILLHYLIINPSKLGLDVVELKAARTHNLVSYRVNYSQQICAHFLWGEFAHAFL